MSKPFLGVIFFLLVSMFSKGQEETQPVKWQFSSKKIAEDVFEVSLTAIVSRPWHIYAQDSPDGATRPTVITFHKNPLLKLEGGCREQGKLELEEADGYTLRYYSGKVQFVQMVRVKGEVKTKLYGTVEFMACTGERCLPPASRQFTIALENQ